ncbi:MAG: protein-tyrosine-phosphatase [Saprospiraceae bacterium]
MANLYPTLLHTIEELKTEFDQIPETRRQLLLSLGNYCRQKVAAEQPIHLNVICTHNSRRSHLGQLWLSTAAQYYGIPNLHSYSGGTESTAFHPNAVQGMRSLGFHIDKKSDGPNPRYLALLHEKDEGQVLFSKKYDNPVNPTEAFAAIMVCTEADRGCPVILGAEQRFAISFSDPKAFDGTEREAAGYLERCRDIGREVLFGMGRGFE